MKKRTILCLPGGRECVYARFVENLFCEESADSVAKRDPTTVDGEPARQYFRYACLRRSRKFRHPRLALWTGTRQNLLICRVEDSPIVPRRSVCLQHMSGPPSYTQLFLGTQGLQRLHRAALCS
jgi:hypothetical protein